MARVCDPRGRILLVAALLLAAAGAGLPAAGAQARAHCLSAPRGDPPDGQHWYYYTDRNTQRKCWHLGPADPGPQSASAQPAAPPAATTPAAPAPAAAPQTPAAAPPAANAASAPPPPADASDPASAAAGTQPAARWCAYFTGGPTDCSFASFEECLHAIKGKTAMCVQHASYVPPAAPDSNSGN